jgi:multidrug resistance efflux pump
LDIHTDVELDRAETEQLGAQQAVLQAEATKEQSKAALELASVARDHATVTAPFSGVLQDVFADVGVQLAPGAPLFDLIEERRDELHVRR